MAADHSQGMPGQGALLQQGNLSAALLDLAGSLIIVLDSQGRIVRFNQACQRITGYSLADVQGRRPAELLLRVEDAEASQAILQKLCDGCGSVELEIHLVGKNGQTRPVACTTTAILDAAGAIEYVILCGNDITERKRIEEMVGRQRREFMKLVENAPIVIARFDRRLRCAYVNRAIQDATGFSPERLIGKTVRELGMPQELCDLWEAKLREVFDEQRQVSLEHEHMTPTGPRCYQARLAPEYGPDGTVESVLSLARDITEQERMQAALHRSRELFEKFMDHSPIVAFIRNADGQFLYANKGIELACNHKANDVLGRSIRDIWPADMVERFTRNDEKVLAGQAVEQVETTGGVERPRTWLTVRFPVADADGQTLIGGVAVDISERVRAERELQRAKEDLESKVVERTAELRTANDRLRHELTERERAEAVQAELARQVDRHRRRLADILSAVPAVVWETLRDPESGQWRFAFISEYAEAMLGYSVEEWLAKPELAYAIVHPDDREWFRNEMAAQSAAGRDGVHQLQLIAKDRRVVWVEIYARIARDEAGTPVGFSGVAVDIMERKKAEAALRESEKRYRLLAEHSGDIISRFTPGGVRIYVSPASQTVLGYAPEELVGRSRYEIIHPDDLQKARERYLAALQASDDQTFTLRVRHKNGHYVHLEMTCRVVRDGQTGSIIEIQTAARDVSDRVRVAERTSRLLEQVIFAQEDERKRIARELHDETSQSLTSLLVGLRTLESVPTLHAAQSRVDDLRQILLQTLDNVRRLAIGLRPSALDDLGLLAAVERYARDYSQAHGTQVTVHANRPELARLPSPIEISVYRIIQEALTNAARHAAAKTIRITLEQQPTYLQAIISDDGRGLDVESVLSSAADLQHLGLHSMRERAALLGGSLDIASAANRGTTITLLIPLHDTQPISQVAHEGPADDNR